MINTLLCCIIWCAACIPSSGSLTSLELEVYHTVESYELADVLYWKAGVRYLTSSLSFLVWSASTARIWRSVANSSFISCTSDCKLISVSISPSMRIFSIVLLVDFLCLLTSTLRRSRHVELVGGGAAVFFKLWSTDSCPRYQRKDEHYYML